MTKSDKDNNFPKGHLLCADHGFFEHVGISDGNGYVYENAYRTGGRGKVPVSEFSDGKKVIDIGFLPGSFNADEIMSNAEKAIRNKKKYNLLYNNCEHFVREICGVDIKSPQIQKAIIAGLGTAIALKLKNPVLRSTVAGISGGLILSKYSRKALQRSLIGAASGLILGVLFKTGRTIWKNRKNKKDNIS